MKQLEPRQSRNSTKKGPDPEAYRDVTHNKGYKNNKK